MTTATLTLADFLLARIAEDQADAMVGWRWKALPAGEYARLQARVLAECEARRRIVAELDRLGAMSTDGMRDGGANAMSMMDALEFALRALALPYADHPDYHEEWRP